MDSAKAIRHLVLAEAAALARTLRAAGQAPHAETVERAVAAEPALPQDAAAARGGSPGGFRLYPRADRAGQPGATDAAAANRAAAREAVRALLLPAFGGALPEAVASALGAPPPAAPAPAAPATDRLALMAVGAIAVLGASLTWWQGHRTFNWVDGTYLLENVNRILSGQVPYRDFMLVLPPLHYLLSSLAFAAGDAEGIMVWSSLVQAAQVILAYLVCVRVCGAPRVAALISLPVAFGGHSIWGFPLYDVEAGAWGMLSLLLLLAGDGRRSTLRDAAAGLACGLVCVTKANAGLALAAGSALGLLLAAALYGGGLRRLGGWLAGLLAPILLLVAWLGAVGGLPHFWDQVFVHAAQARLNFLSILWDSLPILDWGPEITFELHLHYNLQKLIVAAGFFLALFGWTTGSHRRPMQLLILVPALVWLYGTMQANAWGSVYGVYPILSLILAAGWRWARPIAGRLAPTLVVGAFALGGSATALQRDVEGVRIMLQGQFAPTQPFSLPALQGLRGGESGVTALEQLVAWSRTLPPGDKVFVIPGFTPFYLASGRPCPLRNFQTLAATGLGPEAIPPLLEEAGVRWVALDLSMLEMAGFTQVAWQLNVVEPVLFRQYQAVGRLGTSLILRRREP